MKCTQFDQMKKIMKEVHKKAPLIHCITNPISIHDCANIILAAGGRPIMAEHPEETVEITASAQSLVLNLGNITDARKQSILLSSQKAFTSGIPVVLDLVGIGCSHYRRDIAQKVLAHYRQLCSEETGPSMILKGNLSELKTLFALLNSQEFSVSGVDVRKEDSYTKKKEPELIHMLNSLAITFHTVVFASGKADIVTDGIHTFLIENGCKELSRITGTGCMLSALCGTLISSGFLLDGAVLSAGFLGVCGEYAAKDWKGTGTFQIRLMDMLSSCSWEKLKKRLKVRTWNGKQS